MTTSNIRKIRIDSGILRGRYIKFKASIDLRPSKAVVKKTLFNWLRPKLYQASCIDLFAGTGSLGFEAASQGASKVLFLDRDKQVVAGLKSNIALLNNAISKCDLQASVWSHPEPLHSHLCEKYDIILIDPPFYQIPPEAVLDWLLAQNIVHERSLIYLETKKANEWPQHRAFTTYKHAQSGGVQFGLMQVKPGEYE
tara:strand:- start:72 stop:662 length:591 start_codon:yes stop_codon:yes gene_type:complete